MARAESSALHSLTINRISLPVKRLKGKTIEACATYVAPAQTVPTDTSGAGVGGRGGAEDGSWGGTGGGTGDGGDGGGRQGDGAAVAAAKNELTSTPIESVGGTNDGPNNADGYEFFFDDSTEKKEDYYPDFLNASQSAASESEARGIKSRREQSDDDDGDASGCPSGLVVVRDNWDGDNCKRLVLTNSQVLSGADVVVIAALLQVWCDVDAMRNEILRVVQ